MVKTILTFSMGYSDICFNAKKLLKVLVSNECYVSFVGEDFVFSMVKVQGFIDFGKISIYPDGSRKYTILDRQNTGEYTPALIQHMKIMCEAHNLDVKFESPEEWDYNFMNVDNIQKALTMTFELPKGNDYGKAPYLCKFCKKEIKKGTNDVFTCSNCGYVYTVEYGGAKVIQKGDDSKRYNCK
jgi:predicted RNA-binding Zn-ribbon protein involved in translation (DUF1610 family)